MSQGTKISVRKNVRFSFMILIRRKIENLSKWNVSFLISCFDRVKWWKQIVGLFVEN